MPKLEGVPARVAAVLASTGQFGASPRVSITGIRERPRCTLLFLAAGSDAVAPRIIVKIPRPVPAVASSRPRLVPLAPVEERARLEFEALRAVEHDLAANPDPRFDSVSVFGLLDDLGAVVMGEVRGVPLARYVRASARWRRPWAASPHTSTALGRVGAWLRRYQRLPLAAGRPARLATRDEIVTGGREIGEFLARATGRPALVDGVVSPFVEVAGSVLPEALPLGTQHGDFAVRNVLVTANHRVAVLDMLARWRVPLIDDPARMLVALETSRDQAYSLGLALGPRRVRAFEDTFLEGYGDASALTGVHAYAALLALDKWAAVRESATGASVGGRLAILAIDRHFSTVVRRFVQAAAGTA